MHLNEDKEINEIKQTELFNETALLYRLHKVYHHENEYRPRATSTGALRRLRTSSCILLKQC